MPPPFRVSRELAQLLHGQSHRHPGPQHYTGILWRSLWRRGWRRASQSDADQHHQPATRLAGPAQGPPTFNTVQNEVYNALIANAEGTYAAGVALGAVPLHAALQGETPGSGNANTVFLTANIDSPTSGFSVNASGTPVLGGFTATVKDTVFDALPNVTALGIAVNTLNVGDNLQATGAAAGASTLNDTTALLSIGANPAFANNVTMNAVNVAQHHRPGRARTTGFQGNITGLLVENSTNSVDPIQLGGTGQGLNTLLTNININNWGGTSDDANTVVLATAIGSAAATINVSFSGTNLGKTSSGGAEEIAISNDTGGGTAASPNLTYGTWSLNAKNNVNLQLEQSVTTCPTGGVNSEGGVGGATSLMLAGAGNMALGQADYWRLAVAAEDRRVGEHGQSDHHRRHGVCRHHQRLCFHRQPGLAIWQRRWAAR